MALPNDKHELFCQEYLVDLNATQSYMRVYGESKYDTARANGSRLLANADVSARITELIEARKDRTRVTQDYVVDGLVEVANRCRNATPVMVFDPVEKTMVQKQDSEGKAVWEFDSQGANKALELLGKHLGLFIDKTKNENINEIVVRYASGSDPS